MTRDELWEIGNSHVQAAMLCFGCECGIFDYLSRPRTLQEVAQKYGFVEWKLEVYLRALCSFRIVDTYDGLSYSLCPEMSAYLLSNGEESLAKTLTLRYRLLSLWSNMGEILRTEGLFKGQQSFNPSNAPFSGFTELFSLSVSELASYDLPPLLSLALWNETTSVVDIGGGDATIAIELQSVHPHLEIYTVDLPHVKEAANRKISESGASDSIHFIEADLTNPKPLSTMISHKVSTALVCNVLHHLDQKSIERLFWDVHGVLQPSGKLIISEPWANGSQDSELFSLYLTISNPGARLYTRQSILDLLSQCGFRITHFGHESTYNIIICEIHDAPTE